MTLEIEEIAIQMRVVGDDSERDPEGRGRARAQSFSECGSPDREQMVQDVVRRVLRILCEQNRR